MSNPRRLDDGTLLVQLPGEGPDGEITDGMVVIGPEHPAYGAWDQFLAGLGR